MSKRSSDYKQNEQVSEDKIDYKELIRDISDWYDNKVKNFKTSDLQKKLLKSDLGINIALALHFEPTPKAAYEKLEAFLFKAQERAVNLHAKQVQEKPLTGALAKGLGVFGFSSTSSFDKILQAKINDIHAKTDRPTQIASYQY